MENEIANSIDWTFPVFPVLNSLMIFGLGWFLVAWRKSDKQQKEDRKALRESIEAKIKAEIGAEFKVFKAELIVELGKQFVRVGDCGTMHQRLNELATLPVRVARLEERTSIKGKP